MKLRKIILTASVIITGFIIMTSSIQPQDPKYWIAPKEADALKNPLKDNAVATAAGKKLYMQMCTICHGDKGKGDGVASAALNPRPGNFITQKVQGQTDGAIFWKMTNGKPPMAAYKDILKEEQRWQLVNYIRELGKATTVKKK